MREQLLSVREVADILKVSKWTVLAMIGRRAIPAAKIGKGGRTSPYRVSGDELDQYLESRGLHRLPREEPGYE